MINGEIADQSVEKHIGKSAKHQTHRMTCRRTGLDLSLLAVQFHVKLIDGIMNFELIPLVILEFEWRPEPGVLSLESGIIHTERTIPLDEHAVETAYGSGTAIMGADHALAGPRNMPGLDLDGKNELAPAGNGFGGECRILFLSGKIKSPRSVRLLNLSRGAGGLHALRPDDGIQFGCVGERIADCGMTAVALRRQSIAGAQHTEEISLAVNRTDAAAGSRGEVILDEGDTGGGYLFHHGLILIGGEKFHPNIPARGLDDDRLGTICFAAHANRMEKHRVGPHFPQRQSRLESTSVFTDQPRITCEPLEHGDSQLVTAETVNSSNAAVRIDPVEKITFMKYRSFPDVVLIVYGDGIYFLTADILNSGGLKKSFFDCTQLNRAHTRVPADRRPAAESRKSGISFPASVPGPFLP